MSRLSQRLARLLPEELTRLTERVQGGATTLSLQTIPVVARETKLFPLSSGQQRLWFLDQLEPGNAAYTIATAIQLEGTIQIALLEQSFRLVLERHESLRTIFPLHEGQPVQMVQPASTFHIAQADLSSLSADERANARAEVLRQEAQMPFSLECGPLMRARLCQLGEQNSLLILTMHHIISDGWSMSLLVQEVIAHYGALLRGESARLPELPIQYVDYSLWQQRRLQEGELQKHLDYWRAHLAEAPVLELPTDQPRPAQRSYHGALYTSRISSTLVESLRQLGQQERVTSTMILLAAFGVLLARYSGQRDIVVGMPAANRTRVEVERIIGLFMNTLALRLKLGETISFRQLLGQVRETLLSADAHQELPFEKLVEELQPRRSLSQAPFFQVMFIPQNQPAASLELPGLRAQTLRPDRQAAMFDLSLYVFEEGQGIELCAEYNTDLFAETTIARLLHHYINILKICAVNPLENVWRLPLLSEYELRHQLVSWNDTRRTFATPRTLHECVEAQVEVHPGKMALSFGEHSLTYAQLEARSNQLARYLQRRGIGPGCLVGVLLERSPDLVVSLLGILKAGGAYVPLDPEYPVERLAYVVRDSGLRVLLTQEDLLSRVSTQAELEVVSLEGESATLAQEESTRPLCAAREQDLAYVIYTSGSTGKPKGVQISHAAVVNFLCSMREEPGLHERDILLAVTTISFDIAGLEIFLPLTTGACIMLLNRKSVLDGKVLAHYIEESGTTIMQATPATWRLLLDAGWQGKPDLKILCGGEALTRDLADQLLDKGESVWNLYGPTETTIWSTLCPVEAGEGPVSIGRPIANTQVYVLDASLAPVPVGVAGDIYIGGAGVARGYHHRPELTAERFLPDPFSAEPGRCLYRTGDCGCYRLDGTLLYLGRSDQQVKLRGFRIEPGEIEAVLASHREVKVAAVLVREDTPGQPRLVAYLLPRGAGQPRADNAQMRTWLSRHLPDYMIPAVFLWLEAFPLTPNGKIDRRALPMPEFPSQVKERDLPQTAEERTIAAFWQQLLGLTDVGVRQNFFELGGHSLIAPRLMARINEEFEVELPLRALFAAPTIVELAAMVGEVRAGKCLALPAVVEDLQAEVVLAEDIRVHQVPGSHEVGTRGIFLTGASGFLGGYLLAELLQQTRATIYCLIRAASVEEGQQKLRRHLLHHQLWDTACAERIVPVPGDLALPLLGLSSQAFADLARQVALVYHCGARVNFTYPYQALKASNVLGTQEVLRLAGQAGAAFHFVSTLGVFAQEQYPDQALLLEESTLEYSTGLPDGYTQSKWVGEKLARLARSRGINSTIYRPGMIGGHSATGISNTTDLVWAVLKGCIQLGSAPQLERAVNLAPVDYVSKALVHLSLQNGLAGQAFHLFNPQSVAWNSLISWTNNLGYGLRHIPYEQWRAETMAVLKDTSAGNAFQPFLPLLEKFDATLALAAPKTSFFSAARTTAGLAGSAIVCPGIDEQLLKTYISYFVESGFLPEPSWPESRDLITSHGGKGSYVY